MLFYNITELSQVTNQVHLITFRHVKCNLLGMINLGKARYQQYMGIHIGCHSGNCRVDFCWCQWVDQCYRWS